MSTAYPFPWQYYERGAIMERGEKCNYCGEAACTNDAETMLYSCDNCDRFTPRTAGDDDSCETVLDRQNTPTDWDKHGAEMRKAGLV